MKRILSRVLVVLLTLIFVASPALAEHWVKLGEKKVSFEAEQDEIDVGLARGLFKRIKLKVEEASVHFNDVVVVFGNDERFHVEMRDNIEAGGETRAIDLPGEARIIKKIILKYKTRKGSNEKAMVSVLGHKD